MFCSYLLSCMALSKTCTVLNLHHERLICADTRRLYYRCSLYVPQNDAEKEFDKGSKAASPAYHQLTFSDAVHWVRARLTMPPTPHTMCFTLGLVAVSGRPQPLSPHGGVCTGRSAVVCVQGPARQCRRRQGAAGGRHRVPSASVHHHPGQLPHAQWQRRLDPLHQIRHRLPLGESCIPPLTPLALQLTPLPCSLSATPPRMHPTP